MSKVLSRFQFKNQSPTESLPALPSIIHNPHYTTTGLRHSRNIRCWHLRILLQHCASTGWPASGGSSYDRMTLVEHDTHNFWNLCNRDIPIYRPSNLYKSDTGVPPIRLGYPWYQTVVLHPYCEVGWRGFLFVTTRWDHARKAGGFSRWARHFALLSDRWDEGGPQRACKGNLQASASPSSSSASSCAF